ncbi:MAG: GNAT family N-acetyltransferase [Paludibacteraceae bacterium]|nr:GNAT family N-acetyltransferase [Paludibacteraceae bacterium]
MSSGLTSNEFYSLEALSDKQEKESQIKIVPIEKDNEEHLKLILEGCNLDSVASGDELWSLQDVKDAIKLGYDAHERPHGGKHFFLLKLKEEFVGMCTICGNALSGFAIFKQYQGKGYGKQSLKAIIQKMRSGNENKEIVLRVAKKNTKALNLYKSCGFEITDDPYMDKNSYRMVLKPEKQEASTEALDPKIKEKRKYITDYICAICDLMDPSKLNSKRYHRLLDHMSDKDFDQWMHYVKDGKWKLHIVAPNLIINLKNENLLKAADKAKCKLFHRLWMTDNATGRQYLTDNEYLVLTLSVRRQQQYLDEKLSVPDNDRQIDGMTGQVTGDSRACSMTNPEIQILAARGLDATLEELVNVRGGNINAYAEFKRQAEETGEISLNSIDRGSISRVAMVGQILLQSMMIDNNIVGN